MSEREITPTDPECERSLGRVTLWLDPVDLEWLGNHCCCAEDASEAERERCRRIRFRARAALHKMGLSSEPLHDET